MSNHLGARWLRIHAFAAACILTGLAGGAAPRAETAKPITITTADGVPLIGADGALSPAAAALGLANIVGWGAADAAGLTGILARSKLADGQRDVTLTVDSRAQKVVQETLAYHITRIIDDKNKPRRFFNDRRAAFVLMDADTGALVAVGSWPPPPPNAGASEFERLAREPQRDDPLSIPAWRAPAKNDPPGGSLMPLVALAAAVEASDAAAKPDDRIAPMLLGMDRATYRRRLGLDPAAARVPIAGSPYSVENITGANSNVGGLLRGVPCVGDPAASSTTTLNVGIAIKHSYRAYFARLALLLEERGVDEWSKSLTKDKRGNVESGVQAYPPTRLMLRLAQVGIDMTWPADLGANLAAPLARLRGESMLDRLFVPPATNQLGARVALPENLPLKTYRGDYQYRIALGGAGESWYVTPMHLAMGAAIIARGEQVRPHLVAALGGTKLAPPPAEKLAVRADLLAAIRLGMKAVAEAPGATMTSVSQTEPKFVLGEEYEKVRDGDIGRRVATLRQATAKSGVLPTLCRVYAKTGTSDSVVSGNNTGWVMGWKEPLVEGGRRLAFACMVSHLDHAYGGPRFGGAVCGAILRDIHFSLEAMNPPDLRSN